MKRPRPNWSWNSVGKKDCWYSKSVKGHIWHLQKPVEIKQGLVWGEQLWGSRARGHDPVSWSTHFFRMTNIWLKICGLRNVLRGAAGPDQPPHHKPPDPWFAFFVFFLGHLLSLAPGACILYKCPITPWHRTAPIKGRCNPPPFHGPHKRWEPQKDPACKPTSPGYCKGGTARSCAGVDS
jgi:hypothetical protein